MLQTYYNLLRPKWGAKVSKARPMSAIAENTTEVITEQILTLDERTKELVTAAPSFYKNKSLLRLYLPIIPTCLCAAVTLGFNAR
jgi:hypothetical protein